MEPISWSTSVQAAEWIGRAITAARNKDQQRFARLIEHAGTVVAGLRAIDRESRSIFLPMFYGNLNTWPEEKREEWIERLIFLAHEDRVMPALRISLSALKGLESQQADTYMAERLHSLILLLEHPISVDQAGGGGAFEVIGNVAYALDNSIAGQLKVLIDALRDPASDVGRQASRIVEIYVTGGQVSAERIDCIAGGYGAYAESLRGRLMGFGPVTTLRPYADKAEEILGSILAIQNRVFPELPTPLWIWQHQPVAVEQIEAERGARGPA